MTLFSNPIYFFPPAICLGQKRSSRMQRKPLLAPFSSLSPRRSRSLRTLAFSTFLSSMETLPDLSPPIGATDASPATADPGKGILLASSVSDTSGKGESAKEFGFERAEFGRELLVGTVQSYDRHVFLRYKSPQFWPPNVEASESDGLPRLLAAAIKARKNDMKNKARLTICGVEDNTETLDGDVLIFPERIGYRGLTDVDVDNFVESVLVKDTQWFPGEAKTLTGSYVFVCAHGSRDQRCGVCGPILIEKFKEEIFSRGLEDQVFVSPCSHIGGHKYAGNVIIFSQSITGDMSGHWYGYVSPDDVSLLLEQHIGKGEIIDHLWRGQMGLSKEEQRKAQDIRRQPNIGVGEDAAGCCQGKGNTRCCQNPEITAKPNANHANNSMETKPRRNRRSGKSSSISGALTIPKWFKEPDRNTYTALSVIAAIASVGGAYFYYRHRK